MEDVTLTLGLAGLRRLGTVAGSLLTLIGLVVGASAVFKELASTIRGYFMVVTLLVLSLLILPAELGSLSYYVLSAFHPGIQAGGSWELFELQFWYTAFPLVPFLYVAFLFSWIWAPLIVRVLPGSANRAVNKIAEGPDHPLLFDENCRPKTVSQRNVLFADVLAGVDRVLG